MKTALLIHAHANANQVARLVSRLKHDDLDIYINIDGKVDIYEFKSKISGATFLTKRTEVQWGRFSQVEQILNSFQEIKETNIPYSHILFISGLDYPIQPIGKTIDFLKNNSDKSFIDHHKLGNDDWSKSIKKRYEYWFFLPDADLRNNNFIKKLLTKSGFKRRYPFSTIYYGSCWFCLNLEVVKYILKYTEDNPKTVDFFKHSGCSDELYIQSVLLNSPLKNSLENKIYRYFDWSDKGKSPKILTVDDYAKIEKSNSWFARKLDMKMDTGIFDLLDKLNSENEKEED